MFPLIKEVYLSNSSKTLVTSRTGGNSNPVLLCAVMKLEGWLLVDSKIRSHPKVWEPHAAQSPGRGSALGTEPSSETLVTGEEGHPTSFSANTSPACSLRPRRALSRCLPSLLECKGCILFCSFFFSSFPRGL